MATVLDFRFTTVDADGAPFTLGGTPAISVYKDNSDAQSTSGVTLTADADSTTGLNKVRIDTSADGTFYSAGSMFEAVITTGTVDGVSVVGYVVARFSLEKTSALRPTTAGRTLTVESDGVAHADVKEWLGTAAATPTVAGVPEVDVTHVAGASGDKLGAHLPAVLKVVIGSGSTTTSIVLNATTGIDGAAPSSVDNFYNGRVLIFTSGDLAGQATEITDYVGSTVTLTVVALTGAPAAGVTAVIV